jgi:hypothetical protein
MPVAVRALLAVLLALGVPIAAGCGDGGDAGGTPRENAFVDPSLEEESGLVNALAVDPENPGALLLTTNKGFFRIRDGEAERVQSTVTAGSGFSQVGTFLYLTTNGETGELLGSGHPDEDGALPEFLGLMRSNDGGENWTVLTRLGQADLHVIRPVEGRLYAYDAVLGAVLVSDDAGGTFEERFTPRGLVLDMVVDPADRESLLISLEEQLYRSPDAGRTWRPVAEADEARLAWAGPGALYRADADGTWLRGDPEGAEWEPVGEVGGDPQEVLAVDEQTFYVALADASIRRTDDAGATWRTVFDAAG